MVLKKSWKSPEFWFSHLSGNPGSSSSSSSGSSNQGHTVTSEVCAHKIFKGGGDTYYFFRTLYISVTVPSWVLYGLQFIRDSLGTEAQ